MVKNSGIESRTAKYLFLLVVTGCILYFSIITASADSLSISVGNEFTVSTYNDGGDQTYRSFPYMEVFGPRYDKSSTDVLVGIWEHPDNMDNNITDGMKISRNGGDTWPTHIMGEDFGIEAMTKLSDGNLLAMNYPTYYINANTASISSWISTDNGVNWTRHDGTITGFPDDIFQEPNSERSSFSFNRTVLLMPDDPLMPDDTLLATLYGKYDGDSKYRTILIRSTNSGVDWTYYSEVAYDPNNAGEGFCEPVMARVADGSLLCLMRTGQAYPLCQARSIDNGQTWSTPVALPGACGQTGPAPDLELMSNGTLVMSCGSYLNIKLYFSLDGSGYNWSNMTSIYSGSGSYPTTNYSSVKEVEQNKLMVVYDKGADYNGVVNGTICGKYVVVNRTYMSGDRFDSFEDPVGQRPWGYTVTGSDALTSNTEVYDGEMSLKITDTTSSNYTVAYKPTSASAGKMLTFQMYPDAAPYGIQFDLLSGGTYNTNNIVYHLNITSGGTIQWYDGSWHNLTGAAVAFDQWNEVAVQAYNTTYANVYINGTLAGTIGKWNTFSALDGIAFCSASTGGTGEIFYVDDVQITDIDTFEGDTTGQHPTGYSVTGVDAVVSNVQTYMGNHSFKITDTSSSSYTKAYRSTTCSRSKTLQFRIYPVSSVYGIQFDLLSDGSGESNIVYHMEITSNGTIRWYDGTWHNLTGAAVSFNQWNLLKVVATDTSNASVYVDGTLAGTISEWHAFETMDGISFGTASSAGTGDEFYIDNVSIIN